MIMETNGNESRKQPLLLYVQTYASEKQPKNKKKKKTLKIHSKR